MTKEHTDDYKLSAVKYYIKTNSLRMTCEIFGCSKSSLQRWVERYLEIGSLSRKDYKKRKSIITNDLLKFILKLVNKNPTIILSTIKKEIKKKFNLTISKTYIYYIIKYKLNYTTKQLRKKYYPEKKLATLKTDRLTYFNKILSIGIKNIISIDESSFYLNMTRNFGKSKVGKRAYKKTHIYPFKRYNFICAIKYGKIIGFHLYEDLKGGIKSDEFLKFVTKCVKGKYKNHYILMDNAVTHRANIVKEGILKTKNKYIYALPYQPNTNPVEGLFSQIKNYVRQDNPQTLEELKKSIKYTIKNKVKKEHLENYFKTFFLQAQSFVDKNS